jgi:hypothetical protein
MLQLFKNTTFFDKKSLTLAIVNYDLYLASADYFYSVEISFEFEPLTGLIKPFAIKTYYY